MFISWTQEQLALHQEAARLLAQIKDQTFALIFQTPNITEYEAQQFVLKRFKASHLVLDADSPIVAFGPNTAFVHYFPTAENSATLQPNQPIMLDLWARLNQPKAPYADITWMGFNGEPSQDFLTIYNLVLKARDMAISYLQSELKKGVMPSGQSVDTACREVIEKASHGEHFPHTTGHSLGLVSAHGRYNGIRDSNTHPLHKNLGYTIEPGIYLPNQFGVRSEIDCYIDERHELKITTPIQKMISTS